MKPIKFKQQNTTYTAEGCGDLPVYKSKTEIISVWKCGLFKRLKFLYTGKMYFRLQGSEQPPISLDVNTPFIKVKKANLNK